MNWYGFSLTGTEPRPFLTDKGPQLIGTNHTVYRFFLLFAGAAAGLRLRAASIRKSTEATLFSLPNEKHANILYFPEFLSDSARLQSVRAAIKGFGDEGRPSYFIKFIKIFIKNLHNSKKGLIFAGEVLRFI